MIRPALFLCAMLFVMSFCVKAQNMPADSTLTETPIGNAVKIFMKQIGDNAEIYNGREYLFAPKAFKGSPFFGDTSLFRPATIRYNGIWYKNIESLYDSYLGVLTILRPINQAILTVKDSLMSEFYLSDRHFLNISSPDSAGVLKKGFYEDLYHGQSRVLLKHYKLRSEEAIPPTVQVTFKSETDCYIVKDKLVYRVNGRGAVLDVFKDKRSELNAYLKKNKITFNDDRIGNTVKLATYYDQISH